MRAGVAADPCGAVVRARTAGVCSRAATGLTENAVAFGGAEGVSTEGVGRARGALGGRGNGVSVVNACARAPASA